MAKEVVSGSLQIHLFPEKEKRSLTQLHYNQTWTGFQDFDLKYPTGLKKIVLIKDLDPNCFDKLKTFS